MKNSDYLGELTRLLDKTCPKLAKSHRLDFKNCFGAVAGYIDGKIFVSCGQFGIALRFPPKTLAELFQDSDVLPLKYFPNGHVKKEYAVIPKRIIDDQGRFKSLVEKSTRYALSI